MIKGNNLRQKMVGSFIFYLVNAMNNPSVCILLYFDCETTVMTCRLNVMTERAPAQTTYIATLSSSENRCTYKNKYHVSLDPPSRFRPPAWSPKKRAEERNLNNQLAIGGTSTYHKTKARKNFKLRMKKIYYSIIRIITFAEDNLNLKFIDI